MTEYIERGAALKTLELAMTAQDVYDDISELPAADVEPVVREKCQTCEKITSVPMAREVDTFSGNWMTEGYGHDADGYYFYAQGDGKVRLRLNNCPHCGRKLDMDLKEERK